jgi:tetrapyrrole methylase family protein/MazG family protein
MSPERSPHVPRVLPAISTAASVQGFADIVASLRSPEGCPWDKKQTHTSLRPYALEEAAELADAIDEGDDDALCEELGDVLLQVVLHAQLASERGAFELQDVIDGISAKMVRRHPHVFDGASAADAEAVEAQWREAKRKEGRSLLGGVPRALAPLERSQRLTSRASSVGFDFEDAADALSKLDEEVAEFREAIASGDSAAALDEGGDVLFAASNVLRKLDLDPARALSGTCQKFASRFAFIEEALAARGVPLAQATLSEMDALWDESKRVGR